MTNDQEPQTPDLEPVAMDDEDPLYPTELGQIGELLAWLTEHAHRIPRHRQTHVRTLLERVERMVLDDYRT